jgi:hypothetical protein
MRKEGCQRGRLEKIYNAPQFNSGYPAQASTTLRDLSRLPNSPTYNSSHEQNTIATTGNMSDYEDDMDVDASVAQDSVMFSSDNTNSKGKRSAANLPVEAEDSLPW